MYNVIKSILCLIFIYTNKVCLYLTIPSQETSEFFVFIFIRIEIEEVTARPRAGLLAFSHNNSSAIRGHGNR